MNTQNNPEVATGNQVGKKHFGYPTYKVRFGADNWEERELKAPSPLDALFVVAEEAWGERLAEKLVATATPAPGVLLKAGVEDDRGYDPDCPGFLSMEVVAFP